MVPVAAAVTYSTGLKLSDGSGSNPMLSLNPSLPIPLCGAQHINDIRFSAVGLHPLHHAMGIDLNGYRLSPGWGDAVKDSYPSDNRTVNNANSPKQYKPATGLQENNDNIQIRLDILDTSPSQVNHEKLKSVVSPASEHVSRENQTGQPRSVKSDFQNSSSNKFMFSLSPNLMNGLEKSAMTGSSNPRTDHLSWLSDVANREGQNKTSSPNQEKVTVSSSHSLHTTENLALPLVLPNSGSFFCPVTAASPSDLTSQRMYTPPYHTAHPSHHTSSSISGTNHSLYYSQATRMPPYSSFYHNQHPPSTAYRTTDSPAVAAPTSQPLSARSYFQTDSYTAPLASMAPNVQSLPQQLPHSPEYLQHTVMSSSPAEHTIAAQAPSQSQRAILASRSPEEPLLISHSPHEIEKNLPVLRLSPTTSHVNIEDRRKPSYRSPETILGSGTHTSECDTSQKVQNLSDYKISKDLQGTSLVSYRVPTGKEGSLKHRILRPPSINIVEPPPSAVLDAPLSAPPIRSHREPSPKRFRLDLPTSSRSYSSSTASAVIDARTAISSHSLMSRHSPSFAAVNRDTSLPTSPSPVPLSAPGSGSQLQYPASFMKGSIIQLANGQLKQVEHLTTDDFVECAAVSADLRIDSSTVISIEKTPASGSAKLGFSVGQNKLQIAVEAPLEHPFFVFNQGWSSCSPERSIQRYGLTCKKLKVSDVCISLTQKEVPSQDKSTPSSTTVTVPLKPPTSVPTDFVTEMIPQIEKSADKSSAYPCRSKDGSDSSTARNPSQFLSQQFSNTAQTDKQLTVAASVPSKSEKTVLSTVFEDCASSQLPVEGKRKRRWSLPDNILLGEGTPSSQS